MCKCWIKAPKDRPTFSELYCTFSQYIEIYQAIIICIWDSIPSFVMVEKGRQKDREKDREKYWKKRRRKKRERNWNRKRLTQKARKIMGLRGENTLLIEHKRKATRVNFQ